MELKLKKEKEKNAVEAAEDEVVIITELPMVMKGQKNPHKIIKVRSLNLVWYDVRKQEKSLSDLRAPNRQLLYDSMNCIGCQNNTINVNFHLQKSSEIFEKKTADKI